MAGPVRRDRGRRRAQRPGDRRVPRRRPGLRTLVLERRDRVGGALATTELGAAPRCRPLAHTVGPPAVVGRPRPRSWTRHGLHPHHAGGARVRAAARRHVGDAVGGHRAHRRGTARPVAARTPTRTSSSTARVRSIASFLAYLQVATPPNLKTPSLKDAQSGLGLGRALRGMGSRGAARGHPRAADGGGGPGRRGVRVRRGARRACRPRRAVHGHGPVVERHGGGVPGRLGRQRRRRGRADDVRPGRARRAGRRAGGGGPGVRRRDPDRGRGRERPGATANACAASHWPAARRSRRRSWRPAPTPSGRCSGCSTR